MIPPRTTLRAFALSCTVGATAIGCGVEDQLETSFACQGEPCSMDDAAYFLSMQNGQFPLTSIEQISVGGVPDDWRPRNDARTFCGFVGNDSVDGYRMGISHSVSGPSPGAEPIYETAFTFSNRIGIDRAVYMRVYDSSDGECSNYISWQPYYVPTGAPPWQSGGPYAYGAECVFLPDAAAGCTLNPSPMMEQQVVQLRRESSVEGEAAIPLLRRMSVGEQSAVILSTHSADPLDTMIFAQTVAGALLDPTSVTPNLVPDASEAGYSSLENCKVLCRAIGVSQEFIYDARREGEESRQVIADFGGALSYFGNPAHDATDEGVSAPRISKICGTSFSPYRYEAFRPQAWLAKLGEFYPQATDDVLSDIYLTYVAPVFGTCIGSLSSDTRPY